LVLQELQILPVLRWCQLTGGKGLLQLLGLGGIVDDKGVQVAGAADLELDLAAVLLDAAG